MAVSDAELAFRLAVGLFCIVMPSVLFVALNRFLMRLRDDDLVNRALDRVGEQSGGRQSPAAVLTGGMLESDGRSPVEQTVRCGSCGAPNPQFSSYCGSCLERL
jgi:hypothetical protein